MSRRRRSHRIVLVLIGAAALPACTPRDASYAVHDRYASLEDCSADWGRPEVCEQDSDNRPLPASYSGGPHLIYRGPSYPLGAREDAQVEARQRAYELGAPRIAAPAQSLALEHSVPSRGGFGASAHSFGRLG